MSLKDIPENFDIDSEEDLRFLVSQFFLELGFDANEISFEDSFAIQLGNNSIVVGREDQKNNISRGRSDILLTRDGNPLIVIETKHPDHQLTEEDAQQAISYARLTSQITPFALLTNGKETKVFDVLKSSIVEIESSEDSIWVKNGQKLSGLFDDLRIEAAQQLVGINSEILSQFCEKQVELEFKSLKSNILGNKKYIPEIYVERTDLNNSFSFWLNSNTSIYAIVSPSGYGKTNFMCANAEKLLKDHFVLFYSAKNLNEDLYSVICNDFTWEFQRSKNIAQIFKRFNAISTKHKKKLLIFVDGLDETSNQINNLKNELIEISKRLPSYPNIRFVFSCKSFDWSKFIIDHNQSYNLFAETINPDLQKSNLIKNDVNPDSVGYQLGEFSASELEIAIEQYRIAYKLNGEFCGDIKQESANPLMLRFISEVYSKSGEKIPANISSIDLFEKYLNRKLSDVHSENQSQILLTKIAETIFSFDGRFFNQDKLLKNLTWNDDYDQALSDLIRLSILSQSTDDQNNKSLGFEFHKFLLFYYVFKVIEISNLPLPKRRKKIINLLNTKLGTEAVEFYLVVGKTPETNETLLEICNKDFPFFVTLLTNLSGLKKYHKEPISFEAIQAFLDTYNHLRNEVFPSIKNLTIPYSEGQLGIIFIGKSPIRFRGTTKSYPEQYIDVQDKGIMSQVVKGPASQAISEELNPVGPVYLSGIHEFAEFPPLAAYNFFIKELSNIVGNKCLSEVNLHDFMHERAYELLVNNPSIWVKNDIFPPKKRYYELFGFETLDQLHGTMIQDIVFQTTKYLNILSSELNEPNQKGVKTLRFNDLVSLLFLLKSLPSESKLRAPKIKLDDLFKYLRKKNIEEAIPVVESLYEDIINNFQALFEENFQNLHSFSPTIKYLDNLSFIEITWPDTHFHTDYLTLSYGFSEKKLSIEKPLIYSADSAESKTTDLQTENKLGTITYRREGSYGYRIFDKNEFGFLDGPSKFWISKTSFPSRQPIQNQVYKLINNELQYILNPDIFNWSPDHISDSPVNGLYVQKCIKSLF